MELAGVVQLVELFLRDVETMLLKTGLGEFGATWTMLFVEAIVGALAVVKQREQPHYGDVGARLCGEQQAIAFHLFPMFDAVQLRLEDTVGEDVLL